MACSEDQNDQRAAMSTLRGICAIPENRRPVMEANVNDALSLGTRAIDVDVRYYSVRIHEVHTRSCVLFRSFFL